MRRAQRLLSAAVVLCDALLMVASLAVVCRLWLFWRPQLDRVVQITPLDLLGPNDWMPPAAALIVAWIVTLGWLGYYSPAKSFSTIRSVQLLTRAAWVMLLIVVVAQFLLYQRLFSRALIIGFLSLSTLSLGVWRWAVLRLFSGVDIGLPIKRVAVIGVGEDALLMSQRLAREGRAAFRLVGFLRPAALEDQRVDEEQVIGRLKDLRAVVNAYALDTVVIASRTVERAEAMELTTRCSQMGLRVLQVPFTWGIVSPRLDLAELGQLQLINISRLSYTSFAQAWKRGFDLVAVIVGGLAISPILLLTTLLIRLESPGPVLYTSSRVGRGGRVFPFYKFRSMVVDADQLKDALRERNESDGALFKIRDDPRVTRIGRFIRKYSIDEFPQFLNVLRGDMNLVGPRPLPVEDLKRVESDPEIAYWFELRHQVPPGITGLWQVKGRSDLGFQEMVQLDIFYVQSWSVWLDLKILLLTLPAVLKGRGAR